MYQFLPEYHNNVLSQIDPVTGQLELDMSNEDHYRFFLSQIGGLENFRKKHEKQEKLVSKLQQLRSTPLKRIVKLSSDGYHEGPEDRMAIENLIFHSQQTLQTNAAAQALDEQTEGKTLADIMAEYVEEKEHIAVYSELYDITNGVLLHSVADEIYNSAKYKGKIEADYPKYIEDKPREFMITSTFYCTNASDSSDELVKLNAYVTKSDAFTLSGNSDIIKSFTLNAPVIKEEHRKDPNHTDVKISYIREGSIPDYDYTNDDQPFVDGDNKKILVRVPFSVTIEAADRWWITGLDQSWGYRMWLKNMINGTINHYCNFEDIKQEKVAFDDQNRCTKMTITFPESWHNILDFTEVGYKPYANVDFYSGFRVVMSTKNITMPVGVSVKSDGKEYDKLNIQCAKIFIQWGCVARETEIMMADGTIKRADQIHVGELVRNAEGGAAEVKKILTGYESRLYKLTTANRTVRMTPDHIVCTEHGLLPAIDVKEGMQLKTESGLEAVVTVDWSDYDDDVYNFEFEHETILIGNGLWIGDAMLQSRVKELVAYEA